MTTRSELEYGSIADRVSRGYEWLEATLPPNWQSFVSIDTLDLSTGNRCVLGQVFFAEALEYGEVHGFHYAYSRLFGGDLERMRLFGFEQGSNTGVFTEYDELTKEWRNRLAMSN